MEVLNQTSTEAALQRSLCTRHRGIAYNPTDGLVCNSGTETPIVGYTVTNSYGMTVDTVNGRVTIPGAGWYKFAADFLMLENASQTGFKLQLKAGLFLDTGSGLTFQGSVLLDEGYIPATGSSYLKLGCNTSFEIDPTSYDELAYDLRLLSPSTTVTMNFDNTVSCFELKRTFDCA